MWPRLAGGDGSKLKFIPAHSFSLWTTCKITPEFDMGAGVNYASKRFANDANSL